MQEKLHLVLTGSLKRLPAGITGHTQTRYKAYTGLASGDFWGRRASSGRSLCADRSGAETRSEEPCVRRSTGRG